MIPMVTGAALFVQRVRISLPVWTCRRSSGRQRKRVRWNCQIESKRGIAPLGRAHFRYLTRAGWGDAMYHLFLCDEFSAARAHKIGFVQEVVAPGQQIARAMEIADLIARNAPIGIQVTKEAALKYIEAGETAAIDYIPKIKDRVFSSEDMKEGIQSFVERRSAVFRGK